MTPTAQQAAQMLLDKLDSIRHLQTAVLIVIGVHLLITLVLCFRVTRHNER